MNNNELIVIGEEINEDKNSLGFALGIKKQIYNNEIRKRRLTLNMTQEQFAKAIGISVTLLRGFETFKKYPKLFNYRVGRGFSRTENTYRLEAGQKVASFLDIPFEVLFPAWLSEYELERSTIETEVKITPQSLNTPEIKMLTAPEEISSIENKVDQEILSKIMKELLDTLSPREKRILELRFGFDDERPKTLGEVAKEFGVTRERIRQIEAKAIRKLKHPTRSNKLESFSEKARFY